MIKIFMVGRVDEGNSKRCLKQCGNLEQKYLKGGGGEVKPDIVCRWEMIFKSKSLPLPHACSLKNGNHTPIMFIRLCLMNNTSGAEL